MLKCQICNDGRLFKQLQSHLRYIHNMAVEEYKKKYNVKYVMCRSERRKISKRNKGNDYGKGTKGCKRPDMIENDYALGYKQSKEQRKNRSEEMRGNTNAEGNDNALGHKVSEENKEKARIRIIQLHKDGKMMGCERCKMYPVMNYVLGKKVKVQGKPELRFAELLNKLRVRWIRPKPKTYVLDDKEHKYFCDFWLPDEKLYIEVKSRYYYNKNKKEVKTKKKMMIERGERKGFRYKIMFEKDIKEFELNVRDVAETLIDKKGKKKKGK